MQLVCDGGAHPIENYELELNDTYVSGDRVYIQATATISTSVAILITEYSIINSDGHIVGSYEKSLTDPETQTFTISMPLSAASGVYRVRGILRQYGGATIFTTDERDFDFTQGVGASLGPQLSHTQSPVALTNENVVVTVTVDDAAECKNICLDGKAIPDGGLVLTIEENGTHEYEVSFNSIYGEMTRVYTVQVSNIDKEKPVITGSDTLAVREGISATELEDAIRASFSVSDDRSAEERLDITISGIANATDGGTVTVTATDEAGNTSDVFSIAVSVNPEPAQLTIGTPVDKTASGAATGTFALSATLTHTGGETYTETGFVWGSMSVPTVELNNGTASTESVVTAKGGTLTASATGIVKGITYYVRAYAKYADGVLYSDAVSFGLGMPSYGVFQVTNSGNSTFTISRTGGSEGTQTVYYRTVNGSAVGGTHFTHASGTLTFNAGETSKTVTVTEQGVNAVYGNKNSTAYSNADRVYFLEIYRVTGGATIDADKDKATRTMMGGTTIDRTVYNQKTQTTQSSQFEVSAAEGFEKVGDSMDLHKSYMQSERTYLGALGLQYSYHVTFSVAEKSDGYQSIEIVSGNSADSTNVNVDGSSIKTFITGGTARYVAMFEHGGGSKNTDYATYAFPGTTISSSNSNSKLTHYRYDTNQSGSYITFPVATQQYITLGADASGTGGDDWYIKAVTHKAQVFDTQEPQLLGVAPMDGSTYLVGDEITVALIFDEIVDSANSGDSIKNVSIATNYGTMAYAGGVGTNVLYFTGTVPAGASGAVEVTQINSAQFIKDMCSDMGTNTSGTGSTAVTVDTNVPTVAITSATTGSRPTHSATVSASNYQTVQYAWTDSTTLPVAGWQSTGDGKTLIHNQSSGTKVLHLLATHENGKAVHVYQSFTFQYPTLTVTQSDSTTWTASKTLTVTPAQTSGDITIKMEGSQTGTYTGATSVTVKENGTYLFTLTDAYGSAVTKRVEVTHIDPVAPTVTIKESGNTTSIHNTLAFAAVAADEGGSGLSTVEYQFTNSDATPTSGWETVTEANGQYPMTYTATETTKTTKYLHVKVTDRAGNTATAVSKGYPVIKAPADADKPSITLTGAPTDWTGVEAALTWTVTNPSTGFTVNDGTGKAITANTKTGTITVSKNGTYYVSVTDSNGYTAQDSVVVDHIDVEAPTVAAHTVTEGWAQSKTITLIGLTDDNSSTYDKEGQPSYSGSGIASVKWVQGSKWTDDGAQTVSDNTFTVTASGVYTVRITDNVGNYADYPVTVAGVDTTAPAVTLSDIPDGWQSTDVTVTITAADEAGGSGLKSVEYALAESNRTVPTSLTTLNGSSVTVEDGQWYLYYKATDNAGNVTTGWSDLIRVDTTTPTISIEVPDRAEESLTVKFTTTQNGGSGSTVTVVKGDGASVEISGDAYTITAPGTYTFTVTTGAGQSVSTSITVYQVTLDSANGADVTKLLVKAGGKVTQPTDPTYVGYTFQAWNDDSAAWDFGNAVCADLTLTAKWTLNAPTAELAADRNNITYDGGTVTLTATPGHTLDGLTYAYQWHKDTAVLTNTTETLTLRDVADSGDYTVTVTAKDSAGRTASATDSFAVTIGKATLTVTAEDKAMVVGGTVPDYTVKYEGLQNGEVAADVFGALPTAACSADGKTAGAYTITASGEETLDNYAVTYVSGKLLVEPLTVAFDANGGEGTLDALTVANATTALPANTFTRREHTFSGWNTAADGTGLSYTDGATYVPTGENVTLYAQWTERTKYTVGGTAQENGQPAAGITVSLYQGNTVLASTTTDADGRFLFSNVTDGAYDLVARDGKKVTTVLKDVTENVNDIVLDLPVGTVSSKLMIGEPSDATVQTAIQPDSIVVGGLNDEAEAQAKDLSSPSSVTVTMTVTPKTEADAKAEGDHTQEEQEAAAELEEAMDAIRQVSGASGKTMEYLEITVTKTVNDGEPECISETAHVLEIVIPFVFADRQSITVYRYHGGAAEALTSLTEKPTADYEDGSFWLDRTNGLIYVYAAKYSLYSVGYVVPHHSHTYPVTLPDSVPGGSVTVNSSQPSTGSTVTLTVTPDEGYEVGALTVTDSKGNVLTLNDKGDGKYTFTMPSGKVSVQVTFVLIRCDGGEDCPSAKFTDVDLTQWYHEDIDFAVVKGLMNGTAADLFSPAMTTTRGMIVTILYRLEGEPSTAGLDDPFNDLTQDWYVDGVTWAAANGVVLGYGDGRYGPEDPITREQMVAILWRYAKYKGVDVSSGETMDITGYHDDETISSYAVDAMKWAVAEGIIQGDNQNLMPTESATRCQIAAILHRYCLLMEEK